MKPKYSIRGWETYFENSESRKVKTTRFVCVPNKHDGKSYRRLLKHDRATEIFCAWNLILQVASKCPTRGVLADEDGPLDAEDLHLKTGFPQAIFEIGFEVLSAEDIGWLEATTDDRRPLRQKPQPHESEKDSAAAEKTHTETPGDYPGASGDAGRCRDNFPAPAEMPGSNRREGNRTKRTYPPNPPEGEGGGDSALATTAGDEAPPVIPANWRRLLCHLKIEAPPVPPGELSALAPELVALWMQAVQEKKAGQNIRSAWRVALSRHKDGDKPTPEQLRMARRYLHPPPRDLICRCGQKLKQFYCPGSGQSGYQCEKCGETYER